MKKLLFILFVTICIPPLLFAQNDTLYVYGAGGPFGPINECAQLFSKQQNVHIKVTAGPEAAWINNAKQNADVLYGGAEYMLTQFATNHPGLVDNGTRTELYQRGAAILVRPGNPKHISGMKDLSKPGIRILDVNGAGQFGLWEDLAGKEYLIAGIQLNIKQSFENTALGIAAWKTDTSFDAWISYASWHNRLMDITQLVTLPKKQNVFRGTPVVISTLSKQKEKANQFIHFMKSEEGHTVFKKWGWE